MGYREAMVPFKTGLTVVVAVLIWAVFIGDLLTGGFGAESVLWAALAVLWTGLTVRRFRAVRDWRESQSRSSE